MYTWRDARVQRPQPMRNAHITERNAHIQGCNAHISERNAHIHGCSAYISERNADVKL